MDNCDILINYGVTKPLTRVCAEDIPALVRSVAVDSVIMKVKSELDQFIEGLEESGVLKPLRKYPDLFAPMFMDMEVLSAGVFLLVIPLLHLPN
jgi:hypothetical protein